MHTNEKSLQTAKKLFFVLLKKCKMSDCNLPQYKQPSPPPTALPPLVNDSIMIICGVWGFFVVCFFLSNTFPSILFFSGRVGQSKYLCSRSLRYPSELSDLIEIPPLICSYSMSSPSLTECVWRAAPGSVQELTA